MLTKIDIMDPGTNCRDVLEGQTYQLRNGWIGVVNRGQADINARVGGGGGLGAGRRLEQAGNAWRGAGSRVGMYAQHADGKSLHQAAVPLGTTALGSLPPSAYAAMCRRAQMNMGEARRKEMEFFQKSRDYGCAGRAARWLWLAGQQAAARP